MQSTPKGGSKERETAHSEPDRSPRIGAVVGPGASRWAEGRVGGDRAGPAPAWGTIPPWGTRSALPPSSTLPTHPGPVSAAGRVPLSSSPLAPGPLPPPVRLAQLLRRAARGGPCTWPQGPWGVAWASVLALRHGYGGDHPRPEGGKGPGSWFGGPWRSPRGTQAPAQAKAARSPTAGPRLNPSPH